MNIARWVGSPLAAPILMGWIGAAAVLFGLAVSCNKPLPATTSVDVAGVVQCIAADEARGVTDPLAIALDCHLAGAQVVSDIISTFDVRAMRVCRGTIVHPVRTDRDRDKD